MEDGCENKKMKRMTLWKPLKSCLDHDLRPQDYSAISDQFLKKYQASQKGVDLQPDPSKNSLFSKFYEPKPFNLYEFVNSYSCISPLKCEHLRRQILFLTEYAKGQNVQIKQLRSLYENEEIEKNKVCIQAIIMKKKRCLEYVYSIMNRISGMISGAQQVADHIDKMYSIIKRNK